MARLPNAARYTVAAIAVALLAMLSSCDKLNPAAKASNTRTMAEMDAAISTLEATVKGLEAALVRLDASQPKWVLWQTMEVIAPAMGVGPAQPKPFDAFANKDTCLQAGEEVVLEVLKKGEGQAVSALSYRIGSQFSINLVTLRCLPESLDLRGPKK